MGRHALKRLLMELQKTDPEFTERFRHFAFDEVVNEDGNSWNWLSAPLECYELYSKGGRAFTICIKFFL